MGKKSERGGVFAVRFMIGFVSVVAVAYVSLVAALFLFQRHLLYFPDTSVSTPALSGLGEMKTVTLRTADGLDLRSWYRPAPAGRATVVFFHGNAGDISGRGFKVRPYLDGGYGLLLVEYRGYGGNPGKPSEEGLYADGRAALDFLAAEGVRPGLTVLYGESLGSGVAVRMAFEMAAKTPVGAVVLEAPYTSITDVAAYHYPYVPVRLLVKDEFDSASRIAAINCPLFIIHGESDRTVHTKFGRRLFDLASQPKESRWVPGAGHNALYDFGAADFVIDFLNRRFASDGPDDFGGG